MSFLDAQNRLNASVMNRLKNASVLIAGVEVPGIFKRPSIIANGGAGAADTRPSVQIFTSDSPDNPVDSVIEIDGVPYQVGEREDTGTGFTQFMLECTE